MHRRNFNRTYVKLRWFFEKSSTQGAHAIPLDPMQWLYRQGGKDGRNGERVLDAVTTIRILLCRLWTAPPPCLSPDSGGLTPGEKLHFRAEFAHPQPALVRKDQHRNMLNRALEKIDAAFDTAGLFDVRRFPPVDTSEYERMLKRREMIEREER